MVVFKFLDKVFFGEIVVQGDFYNSGKFFFFSFVVFSLVSIGFVLFMGGNVASFSGVQVIKSSFVLNVFIGFGVKFLVFGFFLLVIIVVNQMGGGFIFFFSKLVFGVIIIIVLLEIVSGVFLFFSFIGFGLFSVFVFGGFVIKFDKIILVRQFFIYKRMLIW